MKDLILSALVPTLLVLAVTAFLALLAWAVKALHDFRVSVDAKAVSAAQRLLAVALGLVDDAAADSAAGLGRDLTAAKFDGVVTPAELRQVAVNEWTRVKTFLGAHAVPTLEKGLGVGALAAEEFAIKAIQSKLSSPPVLQGKPL